MTALVKTGSIADRRYWRRSRYHTREMDASTLWPDGA